MAFETAITIYLVRYCLLQCQFFLSNKKVTFISELLTLHSQIYVFGMYFARVMRNRRNRTSLRVAVGQTRFAYSGQNETRSFLRQEVRSVGQQNQNNIFGHCVEHKYVALKFSSSRNILLICTPHFPSGFRFAGNKICK